MMSRSATNGFQAYQAAPASRASQCSPASSAATPELASTKMDSSSSFCTMSAGSTRAAVAATASLGTARGSVPASPNIAGVNGGRGTATMS